MFFMYLLCVWIIWQINNFIGEWKYIGSHQSNLDVLSPFSLVTNQVFCAFESHPHIEMPFRFAFELAQPPSPTPIQTKLVQCINRSWLKHVSYEVIARPSKETASKQVFLYVYGLLIPTPLTFGDFFDFNCCPTTTVYEVHKSMRTRELINWA